MSSRSSREREVREIAIAANSGEATDEQLARLDALIRDDATLAQYVVRVFDQQASLAWRGGLRDSETYQSLQAPKLADEPAVPPSARATLWAWPSIAVGLAFLMGAVAASTVRLAPRPASIPPAVAEVPLLPPGQPSYEARLIGSTACLWDGRSGGAREIGSGLTSGESLHLLEGLAEFKLNWSGGGNATISLEGPAAMMLTSEGMPSLRFGRLTATINASSRPFEMETPVGRLVIADYGSLGVSAFGNDGEIHVFDGSAMLEPAWQVSPGLSSLPVKIRAGEAIRLQEASGGEVTIEPRSADPGYFVAQLSMNTDGLFIPRSYVAAVEKAGPLAYWRFERSDWPRMPNQMGPRFECRINGLLGTTVYQNSQAVEFGVTDQAGEILCVDAFDDEIKDSYSIEFWMKPSHYHVGAVISLVGDPDTPNGVVPHGMLIELGGTGRIPNAVHHPGRVRFLHRSPASNTTELGTSCYSSEAYTLRRWQHVVAVKDGPQMRLYIDGALVAEGVDPSDLPPGMRLLVGRLYPSRRVRPFIGQLDELAIYARALSAAEVAEHYRLVRPQPASGPSI